MNKVHFIAIGGAAMHNLAIALHLKGMIVTGSDDEVFEPSASRLKKHGLLPDEMGWNPGKIDNSINAVILGMHARIDNPELLKAKELGLRIYSYPEYIYEQSRDKQRIVIGGSHGKTTITAIIMHVMKVCGRDFDYMVGSQLQGFETMVKLTSEAPCIILEGDEYLASPVDRRPKFHLYHPHVALISGIAWDHINVFPTFDSYLEQFSTFISLIEDGGTLIWYGDDDHLKLLTAASDSRIKRIAYAIPPHRIVEGKTVLLTGVGEKPLRIFGDHNLANLEGARLVCRELGISDAEFYNAASTFGGAARRLEKIGEGDSSAIFRDFAHSPSKLKATTEAVRKQFPSRKLVACMELHTFSSLSENFLNEYRGSMSSADMAIVYFNPRTIAHKKLKAISIEQVRQSFGGDNLEVVSDPEALRSMLEKQDWKESTLLLMSSGTFDGLDIASISARVIS